MDTPSRMMNQLYSGELHGAARPRKSQPSFYFATCAAHATLSPPRDHSREASSDASDVAFYLMFRVPLQFPPRRPVDTSCFSIRYCISFNTRELIRRRHARVRLPAVSFILRSASLKASQGIRSGGCYFRMYRVYQRAAENSF